MLNIRKLALPVAVTGGLVAAGVTALPAAAAPAVSISIAATSPHYPGGTHGKVDGLALVVYKDTANKLDVGVISGKVTGASGAVAELFAEPFRARKFTATGAKVKLRGNPASYSFSVKPSVATKYEVRVSGVSSPSATIYVTESFSITHITQKCTHTSCTYSYQVNVNLPSAALFTETHKHWYLYQAVGHPVLPKVLSLSTNATASKSTKVKSGEFKVKFTWHIPLKPGKNQWLTTPCTKDSETKDGMGLPGHHGCGNKLINLATIYIG